MYMNESVDRKLNRHIILQYQVTVPVWTMDYKAWNVSSGLRGLRRETVNVRHKHQIIAHFGGGGGVGGGVGGGGWHLGHFHRAISHLKSYGIVCRVYLACTFSQMKSINTFSMFLQSGVPRHFLGIFIAFWTYNLTGFMFMYVNVDFTL